MTCFEEEAKNLTKENMDVQDKWNLIVSSCHNATAQTADEKTKKKKSTNPEIIQLSAKQKDLNTRINSNMDNNKRRELRRERNQTQKKIQEILTKEKTDKVLQQVTEIENKQQDSAKMYEAVKAIRSQKPKKRSTNRQRKRRKN